MKLSIASDLFRPSIGGTETVTAAMAENLSRAHFEVTVIAPAEKGKKSPYIEKSESYEVLRVRSLATHIQANLRFGLWPGKQITEHFEQTGWPEVLHANNLFPLSRAVMKLAKRRKIPLIVGSHLMPQSFTYGLHRLPGLQNWLNDVGWRYITRIYNRADMVVSPTQTGIDYLKAHGLKTKTNVISNGIELSKNRPLSGSKSALREKLGIKGDNVLIYAGRLGVEKQVDVIVRAFAQECETFNATLILLGDGNAMKKLRKLVRSLGLEQRVVFLGYVQDIEKKREYLHAADGFVIASPVELQSLVTMEAMAAGLPVLAVKAGALPELCHNDKNGFTFAEGSSDALAECIYKLLSSQRLRERFSRESINIIAGHDSRLTWEKYEEMYEELVDSKK